MQIRTMEALRGRHLGVERAAIFMILLLFLLACFPAGPAHASTTTKTAKVQVVTAQSSATCARYENTETSQWSCGSTYVVKGSTIVVLVGCVSSDSSCENAALSIGDSDGDSYQQVFWATGACDSSSYCREFVFWANATVTGNTSLTFRTTIPSDFAADTFDLTGVNSSIRPLTEAFTSHADGAPGVLDFTPTTGGIVLAGVAAASPAQFGAGTDYTLVPDQPCPTGCNSSTGDWQAAEYSDPASSASSSAGFTYPSTNDGWVDMAVNLVPVAASTSVSCVGPFVAAVSSECTATVNGNAPNGTVSWSSNSTGSFSPATCTLSQGQCSVSYTPSSVSTSNVTATYGGNSLNPVTAGSFALKPSKAMSHVAMSCTPSPVSPGAATVCTATVMGASPTGSITWASSSVAEFSPAITCDLSGGSCAVEYTPPTATSPVTITATYSGDANNVPSSGVFSLTVAAVTTTSIMITSSISITTGTTASSVRSTQSTLATLTTSTTSSSVVSGTTVESSSPTIAQSSSGTSSSALNSTIGTAYLALIGAVTATAASLGLLFRKRSRPAPND